MEDFNSLLSHEQVELIRARSARTSAERQLHRKEAESVARLIEAHDFPYRSPDREGHRRFAQTYDLVFEETAH